MNQSMQNFPVASHVYQVLTQHRGISVQKRLCMKFRL